MSRDRDAGAPRQGLEGGNRWGWGLAPRWQFRGPSPAGGSRGSGLEGPLWAFGPLRCDWGDPSCPAGLEVAGLEVVLAQLSTLQLLCSPRPCLARWGPCVHWGGCLAPTETDRHTLRSHPPPPPPPRRLAQRGPLWRHLGVCLGLCPRALPREECSRNDKAARGLRDGPVQAPPATNSKTEAPSQEASCLKSPRVRARVGRAPAPALQGCLPSGFPRGVRPQHWNRTDQGASSASPSGLSPPGPVEAPRVGLSLPPQPPLLTSGDIRGSVLWAGLWVEGRAPASVPAGWGLASQVGRQRAQGGSP